jgi:transcriptional regulator with XRE-family HTH domain
MSSWIAKIQVVADGIGVRIAKRRQALRMTQEDLAAELGVSKASVANWESGKHFPKRKLGLIEAVLGVSLDEEPVPPRVRPEVLRDMYADIRASVPADEAELMIANIEAALRGDAPPVMRRRGGERAEAG